MRLLSLNSLTPDDVHRWEDLAARAAEPNPFFEAGFVTTAARSLEAGAVDLLVEESGDGAWAGCLPVHVTRAGRPRLLSSWRHSYSFLGTPLVARDQVEEFARALAAEVGAGGRRGLLILRRSGVGEVLAAIREAVALAPGAAVVR